MLFAPSEACFKRASEMTRLATVLNSDVLCLHLRWNIYSRVTAEEKLISKSAQLSQRVRKTADNS